MVERRNDAFQRALTELRERLREGRFPPGERIAAVELAEDLRLSATPIRQTAEPAQEEDVLQLRGEGEDRRLQDERLVLGWEIHGGRRFRED